MWVRLVVSCALSLLPISLLAQGTKADYQRAEHWNDMIRDKATNLALTPHWLGTKSMFWFRRDKGVGKQEFLLVNAEDHQPRPAFDHQIMARRLSALLKRSISPDQLPISALEFSQDLKTIHLTCDDLHFSFDLLSSKITKLDSDPQTRSSQQSSPPKLQHLELAARTESSPDGVYSVRTQSRTLYLKHVPTGQERSLFTLEESPTRQSISPQVFWSADLSHLVAVIKQPGSDRKVYYIESSPRDQLQPKLHHYNYRKPGDDVDQLDLLLVNIKTGDAQIIDSDLFSQQWDLDEFHWSPDGRELRLTFNQRGHQLLRVLGLHLDTALVRTIIEERSDTFICYSRKRLLHHLPATDEYLWMSERDGWNHLYLYNASIGALTAQVTRGPWVVRSLLSVDEQTRQLIIELSRFHNDQNPYHVHLASIDLDGHSPPTLLTHDDATHDVSFSPDRSVFIDSFSRVDQPPKHVLRDTQTGEQLAALATCDISALLATGWIMPERFFAKGRDGLTDIYGVIHRPSNFSASASYPIIENIYAGPHTSHAPVKFSASSQQQPLAELGFVVVTCDGMGTTNRSKAFHDVCWKNLADAGFPDRKRWITAAAQSRPWMDLTRVGIGGGSAGGQNAMRALIDHHDFYHVATADCGCHDNRMDKIWWNEQWMGWPIEPHYQQQSNTHDAAKMQGKLFLIVGEMDENVDPASTMQVVDALIRANKDFDLLVVPGVGHGAAAKSYAQRRVKDFYVRHLLHVEPRSD